MPLQDGPHLELLTEAIAVEGRAQQALLAGDTSAAGEALREASGLYRESWELASPTSFGRLIGMLKAAVIAGDASSEATYARAQLPDPVESPSSSYALAIAALVERDDTTAKSACAGMLAGSPAFIRAAEAVGALADRDSDRYAAAIGEIVADFEAREEHLTGVPIADTAIMFEQLAEARGMAFRPASPLLPPNR